ncbi:MAG: hypothetical protein ACE5ER_07955 [Nitrospinaceae bacterium]
MDKLEAVQRVMRFSDRIREWVENQHQVYFDDFDNYNVDDYEGGYGSLADSIIEQGIAENIIDKEDLE